MKNKSVKPTQITSCLVLIISLFITTDFFAIETQKQNEHNKYKIIRTSPSRASPSDSCQSSVSIECESNIVIINDSILVTNPDTTVKPYKIRVKGKGNTITVIQSNNNSNSITVIQNDTNSKVSVSQSGNNNKIKISQYNK